MKKKVKGKMFVIWFFGLVNWGFGLMNRTTSLPIWNSVLSTEVVGSLDRGLNRPKYLSSIVIWLDSFYARSVTYVFYDQFIMFDHSSSFLKCLFFLFQVSLLIYGIRRYRSKTSKFQTHYHHFLLFRMLWGFDAGANEATLNLFLIVT